jgi:hypothetical protein
MNVSQVIELAKEWVRDHGSQTPGFSGAHLMGTLNQLPKNTPFPPYKDVDMNVALNDIQTRSTLDISYKGIILECGMVSAERYRSPEIVLSDPELAPNLAIESILSDPFGMLNRLHVTVAQEYPRRKWVLARCKNEKDRVTRGLQGIKNANSPIEALISAHPLIEGLTGITPVADLKPPTHRRCLILMKKVLQEYGQTDLQEKMLKLLGFSHLGRREVERYLQDCTEAFDRAVEVTQTPVLGSFKLHSHVKPYLVEGTQEMIDEGYHREAMYWIMAFLFISYNAIQADAPEEEKNRFRGVIKRFIADIDWDTHKKISARHEEAKRLAIEIFRVTDEIVEHNPEIVQ